MTNLFNIGNHIVRYNMTFMYRYTEKPWGARDKLKLWIIRRSRAITDALSKIKIDKIYADLLKFSWLHMENCESVPRKLVLLFCKQTIQKATVQ